MKIVHILSVILALASPVAANAATLLPNGEQTFFSNSGQPLSSGKVYFYIPGTTSPKNTYKDSAQTILNTNPVVLNAAGRAIIYGSGVYRQIVKDSTGNTIWDQLSTDTSGTFSSYGGVSTGSSNAQVVVGTNFSAVTGQSIVFISGFTSSGPVTLSPDNGQTSYATVIDTPIGPEPLVGGELVKGNFVNATFDNNGIFHLTPSVRSNPQSTIASASTTDLGSLGTNYIQISGTSTIDSLGTSASTGSPLYDVFFTGALTLTNSANLFIPYGNLTTSAGDYAKFVYLGNGVWHLVAYFPENNIFPSINATSVNATSITATTLTTTSASNLNVNGVLYSGLVTPDALYSSINGSIITAPSGAVRAQNVVSARASFSGSGFNTTFNVSNIANSGTGTYTVTFQEALLDNNYNVVAACSLSSTNALVCPLVSNKTNGGFILTFFNTSGAATNIGSNISDLIVSGGN